MSETKQRGKIWDTWWIAGSAMICPDTLGKIDQLQIYQSKKKLQQFIGTLRCWRKHVPLDSLSLLSHYTNFYKRQNSGNGILNMRR